MSITAFLGNYVFAFYSFWLIEGRFWSNFNNFFSLSFFIFLELEAISKNLLQF